MFEYIGGTFFSYVGHFVNEVSAELSIYASGLILAAATLYYMIYGFAVMRGEVHQPIGTIIWRSTKMAIIFFVACGAGVYQTEVIGTIKSVSVGLMSSVANVSSGSCGSASGSDTAILSVLDCNVARGLLVFDSVMEAASKLNWYDIVQILMLLITAFIYAICYGILLVAVGLVFFTNLLTLHLALAVGPLFIAALAFEQSKGFFDGWKTKIVYCLTLQLFIMILIGMAFAVINNYIIHTGFVGSDGLSVVVNVGRELESMKKVFSLCVIVILFAYMFTKLDNIANSLVGGGDSSSGLGMALATTQLVKTLGKSLSGNKNTQPGGGNIENKTPSRSDTGKHIAHQIAERFRNR